MSEESNLGGAVVQKRFDTPDEVKEFEKGRFEVVRVGSMLVGRATYQPGWKWSEHVGMVISGTAAVAFEDGRVISFRDTIRNSAPQLRGLDAHP